ncbi:MAG TPA: pilus assembly protein TadG-related protein [Actinomycetota bacterium]|nr:pilus assembly protein TadG-related protein [Actinomycetota bacterium]
MARAGGRAGERGSVAVLVALALTVLLGLAALAVDVGLSWAVRAEAQTAADAAALAGASGLPAGPAGAVAAVRQYLDANVPGLADRPADPNWPLNGTDDDGEVVCWTLPGSPPAPGAGCPPGSNALQVTTPPISVRYAFASVLGPAAHPIRALAAATAGPLAAVPGLSCGLCLLDPLHGAALAVAGSGDVVVEGAGITVDSIHPEAAILSASGNVLADQTGIVGGVSLTGSGEFVPPATTGVPPAPDPLATLPTPDALPAPPPCCFGRVTVTTDRTLTPGVYQSITVTDDATLTLDPGVYVLTELPGLAVLGTASVQGTGITLYLTCNDYPQQCDGFGAGLTLTSNARYAATAPTTGPYAALDVFSDRGNATPLLLATTADTTPTGTIYAKNARLVLASRGDLRTTHPLVLARLTTLSTGSVRVTIAPPTPATAPSHPVLIR